MSDDMSKSTDTQETEKSIENETDDNTQNHELDNSSMNNGTDTNGLNLKVQLDETLNFIRHECVVIEQVMLNEEENVNKLKNIYTTQSEKFNSLAARSGNKSTELALNDAISEQSALVKECLITEEDSINELQNSYEEFLVMIDVIATNGMKKEDQHVFDNKLDEIEDLLVKNQEIGSKLEETINRFDKLVNDLSAMIEKDANRSNSGG